MKSLRFITLTILIAASSAMQAYGQGTMAPLPLFINGGGTVSPLTNGELLEVGETYNMVATPDAASQFNGWNPVNVFTLTSLIFDTNGVVVYTNVSTTLSPLPTYTNTPSLSFIMQPVQVLFNSSNGTTLTLTAGWQANFGPVVLGIQLGDSAVILTWTNPSFALQAAPTPSGVYTNIPGAVSPYTNNIIGAQYFRLLSN